MLDLVADKLERIDELCRNYKVHRLDLFGSATEDARFNPAESDLDFLVEFEPLKPGEYADTYFGLLESLEALFGRHIDLVMESAIKNRFFRQAIENTREVVYAA